MLPVVSTAGQYKILGKYGRVGGLDFTVGGTGLGIPAGIILNLLLPAAKEGGVGLMPYDIPEAVEEAKREEESK